MISNGIDNDFSIANFTWIQKNVWYFSHCKKKASYSIMWLSKMQPNFFNDFTIFFFIVQIFKHWRFHSICDNRVKCFRNRVYFEKKMCACHRPYFTSLDLSRFGAHQMHNSDSEHYEHATTKCTQLIYSSEQIGIVVQLIC